MTADEHLWRPLYPFRSHYLELHSGSAAAPLRYHYVDEGRGEVLLMVHGNPTWSFYWRNLISALCDEYRAVAVDHVGCGLSDKPQDYPYTLNQHTDNLLALVHQLDLRGITLVVHDWGGAIGLNAALEVPDRIRRLVLFNTGAFPPPFIPRRIAICRTPVLGPLAVRGANLFARAALMMAVADRRCLTAPVRAGLLAPYDNWHNRIAIQRFVEDIPRSDRHPTWHVLQRLERRLPQLADRPVLMIWGMRDWCFTPACLERLLESLPRAQVHRLEQASHYVVEEAHEEIMPLLRRFLAAPAAAQEQRDREDQV